MKMYGIDITPNTIIRGSKEKIEIDNKVYKGFYISYNDKDIADYGCDTTAIVIGQMEKFYILNGDHRKEYSNIVDQGINKCLEYFEKNIDKRNKHSDIFQSNKKRRVK
jgi:hypothetical protein